MSMSDIFGGSQSVDVLTRGQKRLLNDLTGMLQGELGQAGPQYDGPLAPGLSGAQRQGLGIAEVLGSGSIPGVDSAISDMVAGRGAGEFDADTYFTQAVLNPAQQALDDEMRAIEARYGAQNSGGFANALGEGVARFGTNIGAQMADLAREERGLADARRAAGVSASFGRNQDLASTAAALMGPIGGIERGVEADLNLADLNKWQQGQAYNNPWLGFMGPALGTQAFGVGQQQGWLPGIAGAMSSVMHPLS